MSRLLLEERPLVILPSLAEKIGLNEAIMLQQIHYWISHPNSLQKDGRNWHYDTYDGWKKQFKFWSLRTIQRVAASLENMGLVISKEHRANQGDRTKWYTIDYEVLTSIDTPSRQLDETISSSCPDHLVKLASSTISKNTTKTTKTITDVFLDDEKEMSNKKTNTEQQKKLDALSEEEIVRLFDSFWEEYPNKKGKTAARNSFIKIFKGLSPEKAKELFAKIANGLISFATEWKIIESLNASRRKKIFCPPIPWGSTWIAQKRWEDTYMSTEEEVLRGYI